MHETEPNLHYFYWRWDVYKRDDYEPVKIYGKPREILASRYHWFILTVWPEPKLLAGKPVVDFFEITKLLGNRILAFHTPLAISESSLVHFGELQELSAIESFLFYYLYLPFLRKEARKRARANLRGARGYISKLVQTSPPENYLLDFGKIKAYFVVSDRAPSPSTLPQEISSLLWPA